MTPGSLRTDRRWTFVAGTRVASALAALGWMLAGAQGATAAAAPGSLAFGGCVSEPSSETCAATGYGLAQPAGLAVSPDGNDAYAAGAGGGAVVQFARGSDGSLSFVACYGGADTHLDAQCSSSAGVITPVAVAVSPDGHDVYALDAGKIDVFTRASDGALSADGCIGDLGQPGCAASAPGDTLYPYRYGAIAVSTDGQYVYTATDAGGGGNGAVDVFARAADGTLSPVGCIAATGGTESHCSSESPAVAGAGALAVGNGVLYVGGSQAVASFTIHTGGGLTAGPCIGSATGCTADANLVGADASPDSLALSPDGATLYVSARGTGELAEFSASAGSLRIAGCVAGSAGAGCGTTVSALCGPTGLAVSGDGADLYVLDGCSNALLTFARGAGGTLAYQGCLADTVAAASCAASGPGLDGPLALAITPDDSQVLVSGQARDSVAAFTRTPSLAPHVAISAPGNGATYVVGQPVAASYACTRATGGAPISACTGNLATGAALDTSHAGTYSFTVTATDIAGLQTKVTVTYTVIAIGAPGSVGSLGGSSAGGGSSGSNGGATGSAAAAGSRTSLTIRGFRETRRRFGDLRGRGVPVGTVFTFHLSRSATVTLTFSKRLGSRTKILGRIVLGTSGGSQYISFTGRVAGSRLTAGRYSVIVTARARGAHRAASAPLHFTILAGRVRAGG
jgi:sugar lactone lactonase YvrE